MRFPHQQRFARVSLALLVPVLLLSCSACSRPSRQATIALITPLTVSDLWKGLHAGVYRACWQAHCAVYWNGPTHEDDSQQQIVLVERQVRQGVAGLVLAPDQSSALIPAVAEAQAAHVPVVLAEDQLAIAHGQGIGSVVSDSTRTGEIAASYLAGLLHGHGEVAIAGVDPGSSINLARVSAFQATIASRFPGIRIAVVWYEAADPGMEFNSGGSDMLLAHHAIQGIFTPSLAGTRTAYSALQQAGELGHIHLVVCDQDVEEVEPLDRGEIDGIVAENVFEIGYRAAHMIVGHMLSGAPLSNVVVQPLLLTRDNIELQATQRFLHPYSGYDR